MNDQAAQLAAASGLFGSPPKATPKPKTPAKPRKPSAKSAAKKQPCDSQDVNSAGSQQITDDSDLLERGGYWSETAIYARIKGIFNFKFTPKHNSQVQLSAREIAKHIDRLRLTAIASNKRAEKAALACASLEGGDDTPDYAAIAPPTQEELVGIISKALRDPASTGSDKKGLTATLQGLLPDLFRDDKEDKPDPSAVLTYVTSFAGMTGEQIVESMGGPEFVQEQLADVLKTEVVLPDYLAENQ